MEEVEEEEGEEAWWLEAVVEVSGGAPCEV